MLLQFFSLYETPAHFEICHGTSGNPFDLSCKVLTTVNKETTGESAPGSLMLLRSNNKELGQETWEAGASTCGFQWTIKEGQFSLKCCCIWHVKQKVLKKISQIGGIQVDLFSSRCIKFYGTCNLLWHTHGQTAKYNLFYQAYNVIFF